MDNMHTAFVGGRHASDDGHADTAQTHAGVTHKKARGSSRENAGLVYCEKIISFSQVSRRVRARLRNQ